MSSRTFILLAVLAVAALAAALLIQRPSGGQGDVNGDLFLPTLQEKVNAVNRIEIVGAGNSPVAELVREEARWVDAGAGNYPADWTKIRQLLADLAAARVVETKTDNPEYYDRLGVGDIDSEDAGGHLVRLSGDAESWTAIIGKSARNRQGQYARLADAGSSVLLDKSFNLSSDRLGWVVRDILDLVGNYVRSVVISHPDGERVALRLNDEADTDYELLDVPDGREIKSNYAVNSIAGGLSNLRLDDVKPVSSVDFSDSVTTVFETFDGRRISLDLVKHDEKSWLKITAERVPGETVGEESAPGDRVDQADEAKADPDVSDADDPAGWVADTTARTAGWAYAIPGYKYDLLAKRMDDLLESPDEEGGESE